MRIFPSLKKRICQGPAVVNKPFFHIIGTYWFIKYIKRFFRKIQTFSLCIRADVELSYRLLLSLHSIIAVSVYPYPINSWVLVILGRIFIFPVYFSEVTPNSGGGGAKACSATLKPSKGFEFHYNDIAKKYF